MYYDIFYPKLNKGLHNNDNNTFIKAITHLEYLHHRFIKENVSRYWPMSVLSKYLNSMAIVVNLFWSKLVAITQDRWNVNYELRKLPQFDHPFYLYWEEDYSPLPFGYQVKQCCQIKCFYTKERSVLLYSSWQS